MTNKIELENVFRAFVEQVTGRPTYIENQMESVPRVEYCTIWVQPTRKLANDVRIYSEDGTTQTIRSQSEFDVKISAWDGDDAFALMQRVQSAFSTDEIYLDIYRISGRRGMTEILDLTADFEGRRQRRAEFTYQGYANFEQVFTFTHGGYFDKTNVTAGGDTALIGVDNPPPHIDQTGCNGG